MVPAVNKLGFAQTVYGLRNGLVVAITNAAIAPIKSFTFTDSNAMDGIGVGLCFQSALWNDIHQKFMMTNVPVALRQDLSR